MFMEGEPKSVAILPEDILTTKTADLLQAAERGERPCPNPGCGLPLRARN